jgi:RNA polymerase sigma factor (TIGR02999 family)
LRLTVLVSQVAPQSVHQLLARWRAGDELALEALVALVYNELRALAHRELRRERPGHTLQTTALVNEAYLRLVGGRPFEAESRAHFVAVAARLMRHILVDYARSHHAAKRGADRQVGLGQIELEQIKQGTPPLPPQIRNLISLHDALNDLSRMDEQQRRIAEMRFFGGLSVEETADVLGISRSTAKRDSNVAKAWLSRHIRRRNHGKTRTVAKD